MKQSLKPKEYKRDPRPGRKCISRITGLFAFLFLFSVLMLNLSACKKKPEKKTLQLFALDTYVTVTVEGEDSQEAVNEAARLITKLEDELTSRKSNTPISRLNASSENAPVTLPVSAYAVLEIAFRYKEKTGGIFDPCVAPLMDVWGFSTGEPHVPYRDEIESALARVENGGVCLLGYSQAYVLPGTKIDLGGAAKGYIGNELMNSLRRFSLSKIVLDLGGNIMVWSENDEMTVGITDPGSPSALCAVVHFPKGSRPQSVITSGAYERFFEENGVRYGHIMDPRSGYPVLTDLLSATVIGPDGATGDILSTTLFAMGREKAIDWASKNGINCVLCDENGTLWVSSALKGTIDAEKGWTIEYFG